MADALQESLFDQAVGYLDARMVFPVNMRALPNGVLEASWSAPFGVCRLYPSSCYVQSTDVHAWDVAPGTKIAMLSVYDGDGKCSTHLRVTAHRFCRRRGIRLEPVDRSICVLRVFFEKAPLRARLTHLVSARS